MRDIAEGLIAINRDKALKKLASKAPLDAEELESLQSHHEEFDKEFKKIMTANNHLRIIYSRTMDELLNNADSYAHFVFWQPDAVV